MKLYEIRNNIEIQSAWVACYYDYEKEERIIIPAPTVNDCEVKYMYCDLDRRDNEFKLFIEVDLG